MLPLFIEVISYGSSSKKLISCSTLKGFVSFGHVKSFLYYVACHLKV